jgi:hypothetical protein
LAMIMLSIVLIEIHFTTLYMADLGTRAEPLGTRAPGLRRREAGWYVVWCWKLSQWRQKISFNVANHLLFCIQKNSLIFYKNLKANWQWLICKSFQVNMRNNLFLDVQVVRSGGHVFYTNINTSIHP